MNRAYLGYIYYMHLNHEYFWRIYELNEYLAKICMHSLLRPLHPRTRRPLPEPDNDRSSQRTPWTIQLIDRIELEPRGHPRQPLFKYTASERP